ncbi:fimbrial protein [Entomohabitans teleogrylli]|uniref:fimbrial protein n=1 Tax=Entomohabitans teleogrylli TaxID=1384589 RepID=UPI00073D9E66|nr:fimbrial protein [Entomohabitans teleogrylli]
MMVSIGKTRHYCLGLLAGLFAPLLLAANNGSVTQVTISGVIIDTPACTINNQQTIHVSFGRVGVNKVESGDFRQPIPYNVSCDQGDTTGMTLKLILTGSAADFDADNATIVSTERSDLGIKIYQDGEPFKLNEPVGISADNIPQLEAVLVQRSGVTLNEGDFSATATLKAEYQ